MQAQPMKQDDTSRIQQKGRLITVAGENCSGQGELGESKGKAEEAPNTKRPRQRRRLTKRDFHGLGGTPEHRAWAAMLTRTSNPNQPQWHNYGGRGITVCERWSVSFLSFLADMGKKPTPLHSIDRIDVNGNYEPGNCRWASVTEQAANRRGARHIEYEGKTMNAKAWSLVSGVSKQAIYERFFAQGWSAKDAIFTPLNHKPI